jgi:hypothetical protein
VLGGSPPAKNTLPFQNLFTCDWLTNIVPAGGLYVVLPLPAIVTVHDKSLYATSSNPTFNVDAPFWACKFAIVPTPPPVVPGV